LRAEVAALRADVATLLRVAEDLLPLPPVMMTPSTAIHARMMCLPASRQQQLAARPAIEED
jgi:hypothetical protein